MKKLVASIALLGLLSINIQAQTVFSTQSAQISFYSATPVENIDAHSTTALCVMSIERLEMAFSVRNNSFEFKNKLMKEHFNEKYMESEKYPTSTFKGKINEKIDLTKDGEYKVTVTGKLNIHGVEKDRTINGVIQVKEGKLKLIADFKVLEKDHNIEIPTIVTAKIAEEITVHVDALLEPKK